MAVPSSGELSLLGIRREVSGNNYNSSTNYTNISLEDLSDGTVATINTSNASADRPNTTAPHQMSEFYNYDHDLSTGPVIPTISYSTTDIDNLTITWDMASPNTKVYFRLVESTLGHADIINGDYDDTDLEIDGESFQTSAGSHDILGGSTTVDDGNEDLGTGNFANKSITIKARGRDASNTFSNFSSNLQAFVTPGPVTSLSMTARTNNSLTFGWTAPVGGVRSSNGYRFYFGTNSNTFANTSTFGAGSLTNKSYTGLIAGTTYHFGVESIGDNGDLGKANARPTVSSATTSGGGGFGQNPSDRRLKTNIELIGHSDTNIPIYLFSFKTNPSVRYKGVMAQDLLEMNFNHVVQTDENGYYEVLYDLIDVDMEQV